MRRPGGVLLLLVLALVAGCAETARLPRPGDFPFHSSDDPFFDLHWRLDRTGGTARAVGLVEAARVDGISYVTVELRELDAEGRVVSSAQDRTLGGRLARWDWKSFTVDLHPRSQSNRLELKVASFGWWTGPGR